MCVQVSLVIPCPYYVPCYPWFLLSYWWPQLPILTFLSLIHSHDSDMWCPPQTLATLAVSLAVQIWVDLPGWTWFECENREKVKIVEKMNSRSRKVEKLKTKTVFGRTIQTCWPSDLEKKTFGPKVLKKKNVRSKSQKCLMFPFVVNTPSPCSLYVDEHV